MKIINIYGIIALFLLSVFMGCEREEAPLGPEVHSASDDFRIISSNLNDSAETINFAIDSALFKAEFNEKVSWEITIKSLTSGAEKTLNGTGKTLKPKDATWNGTHDGLFFFKKGDTCLATLRPFGSNEARKDTIIIDAPPGYGALATEEYYYPPDADLENESSSKIAAFDGEGNVSSVTEFRSELDAPQGENYFYFKGSNTEDVFISGLRIAGTGGPFSDGSDFWPMPKDPEKIWINLFVYGTGSDNIQINVEFREADSANLNSPDGSFDPLTDDSNGYQIFPDHQGWKLYSFKYTALNPSASVTDGGSGNKVLEPHRVVNMQIGFLATLDAQGQTVEARVDFPIITYGGPFDPSKK